MVIVLKQDTIINLMQMDMEKIIQMQRGVLKIHIMLEKMDT